MANKKQNKQAIGVILFVAVLFAIFLGAYFYVKSLDKFEYAGVNWEKIDNSGMKLYHARFPIGTNGSVFYNLYLRNDPRKNNVSVSVNNYFFFNNVSIAIDDGAGSCYGAAIGNSILGQFLGAFNLNIDGAFANETMAKQFNASFANCSSAINKTVILIQKSNETSIIQDVNPNCYIVNVGNCENTKTVEKLIVDIINSSQIK